MKKALLIAFALSCALMAVAQQVQPRNGAGTQITSVSGNGHTLVTGDGPVTPGDGGDWDANGNWVDSGSPASGGSSGATSFTVGVGGVTANMIVSFDSSGNAIASTGTGFGGLAVSSVSQGGTVQVLRNGSGPCIFDGAAVINDVAVPSTTTHGECHDSGLTTTQSITSNINIVGAIESAASGAGQTGAVRLHGPGSFGAQALATNLSGQVPPGNLVGASTSYNPTAYYAYGDSITQAANGSVTYPNNAYVNRLGSLLSIPGGSITNRSVSGAMAGDVMSLQILPNDAPVETAQQPLRTMLESTNEADLKGAGAYEATFNTIYQAILSWESIAAPYKVMGSTVVGSTTGTCSEDTTYADALGVICTSSGAIAPFSITTTGGPIYIWYRVIDSDAGTFTYAVDGGSTVAVTTALTTAIATTNGTTASVGLIRVPVSAAAHTISFVKTDAGGHMGIIGVGTVSNSLVASQPYIIVGDTPSELNAANASAVAAYRTDIDANVALLAGDGLNIQLKYVSKYLIATTAASDMYDSLHPNDQGHGELEAAFLAGSGLFPANSGASPYYNAQTASYAPGPGNQIVSVAASSATVTLNTQPAGTINWIVNRSGSSSLALAPGSGSSITGITTVPPAGSAWAISVGSGWIVTPMSNAQPTPYNAPGSGFSIGPGTQSVIFNCSCTLTLGTGLNGEILYVANYSSLYPITLSGNVATGPTSIPPQGGAVLMAAYSGYWLTVGTQNAASRGTAALVSGTATVSNVVACSPGSSCIYKLTNCGPNASAGIGVLSLGTVTAGTSFVINSLSPVAAVLTTDASTVCWQIN